MNVYLNEYVCISYCIYSLYLFNVCYMPLTHTLGIPVHFIKFYSILFYSLCVDKNALVVIQNCNSDTFYIPCSSSNNCYSTRLKIIIQALLQSEKLREI